MGAESGIRAQNTNNGENGANNETGSADNKSNKDEEDDTSRIAEHGANDMSDTCGCESVKDDEANNKNIAHGADDTSAEVGEASGADECAAAAGIIEDVVDVDGGQPPGIAEHRALLELVIKSVEAFFRAARSAAHDNCEYSENADGTLTVEGVWSFTVVFGEAFSHAFLGLLRHLTLTNCRVLSCSLRGQRSSRARPHIACVYAWATHWDMPANTPKGYPRKSRAALRSALRWGKIDAWGAW